MKYLLNLIVRIYRRWIISSISPYPSYSKAKKASADGYSNYELVKKISSDTNIYIEKLNSNQSLSLDHNTLRLSHALLLSFRDNRNYTVLDFGGACGAHYFLALNLLSNSKSAINHIHWSVIETDEMIKTAKLLHKDNYKDLAFINYNEVSTKPVYKNNDLLIISSSLQYVSDPVDTLNNLIKKMPKNIFVTRTPLILEAEISFGVQSSKLSSNGPSNSNKENDYQLKYPITFLNKATFLKLFNGRYELVYEILEMTDVFFTGTEWCNYYTFYFKRITDQESINEQ